MDETIQHVPSMDNDGEPIIVDESASDLVRRIAALFVLAQR